MKKRVTVDKRKARRKKRVTQKQIELRRLNKLSYGMRKRGYELKLDRLSTATLRTLRSTKQLYRYARKDGKRGEVALAEERRKSALKAAETRRLKKQYGENYSERLVFDSVKGEFVKESPKKVEKRTIESVDMETGEVINVEVPVTDDEAIIADFYERTGLKRAAPTDIVYEADVVYNNFMEMLERAYKLAYERIENHPSMNSKQQVRAYNFADMQYRDIKAAIDKAINSEEDKVKCLQVLNEYDFDKLYAMFHYADAQGSIGAADTLVDMLNEAVNAGLDTNSYYNPAQMASAQSDYEYDDPDVY